MQHSSLAEGKWFQLSLMEQMANIGSDIHRLAHWEKKKDQARFDNAFDRALELIDLTLADPRWKTGYKEIARVREVLCDIYFGENQYQTSADDLDKYFMHFAMAARK